MLNGIPQDLLADLVILSHIFMPLTISLQANEVLDFLTYKSGAIGVEAFLQVAFASNLYENLFGLSYNTNNAISLLCLLFDSDF